MQSKYDPPEPIPTTPERVKRALDALRGPSPVLSKVPNMIRESLAEIIEDLSKRSDKYGLALLIIEHGGADPINIARDALARARTEPPHDP